MILQLSWRNVWRNPTRSLVIMASVAIGLFAGVFVLGLYDGMLRARVHAVIYTEVGHIQIHHPHFKEDFDPALMLHDTSLIEKISKMDEVRGIAHRSVTQGMLATATGSAGVLVNGVRMNEENVVSSLKDKIREGGELISVKKNGILIGKKLADKMKLRLGSKLVLTFTDTAHNITAGAFRVSGIYQTDNDPLDERNVYVHRTTLNGYLGIGEHYHEAVVLLNNDKDLANFSKWLREHLPDSEVKDWKQNSPETNLMVNTMNEYSLIIIVIIMLALAFGIINTMLMSVLERTREIGMLTALGMNRAKVFILIISETFWLTLVGAPVGFLFAWSIINHLSKAGMDISSFSGAAMSGFGFSSIIYPEFPNDQIQMVVSTVLVTAFLSSLLPSLRAIKLQPADALRQ